MFIDMTKEQTDILPDMSQELASMGRGSMARRIAELERLVIEIEYTSSFLDRSPTMRVQQMRNQIQRAREDGVLSQGPK